VYLNFLVSCVVFSKIHCFAFLLKEAKILWCHPGLSFSTFLEFDLLYSSLMLGFLMTVQTDIDSEVITLATNSALR